MRSFTLLTFHIDTTKETEFIGQALVNFTCITERAAMIVRDPSHEPVFWTSGCALWRWLDRFLELGDQFYETVTEQAYWNAINLHLAWNRDINNGACTCDACTDLPAPSNSSTATPAAPSAAPFASSTPAPATSSEPPTPAGPSQLPSLTPTAEPTNDLTTRPKIQSLSNTKPKPQPLVSSNAPMPHHEVAAITTQAHNQNRSQAPSPKSQQQPTSTAALTTAEWWDAVEQLIEEVLEEQSRETQGSADCGSSSRKRKREDDGDHGR